MLLSSCRSAIPFTMAQRVKCLPARRETHVRSLGREDPLEKAMAPHSSTLAWRIPWREEPGGLQSTGSQSRTGLSDFTSLTICRSSLIAQMVKIRLQHKRSRFNLWVRKSPWRKKWQPIPVLLPGKSRGLRNVVGYSPWGHKIQLSN